MQLLFVETSPRSRFQCKLHLADNIFGDISPLTPFRDAVSRNHNAKYRNTLGDSILFENVFDWVDAVGWVVFMWEGVPTDRRQKE